MKDPTIFEMENISLTDMETSCKEMHKNEYQEGVLIESNDTKYRLCQYCFNAWLDEAIMQGIITGVHPYEKP